VAFYLRLNQLFLLQGIILALKTAPFSTLKVFGFKFIAVAAL
jgi:hypothetical protein